MDSTTSAFLVQYATDSSTLDKIVKDSDILNHLSTISSQLSNLKGDQDSVFLTQIIASFFAIVTALFIAFLMPWFVRFFQKPNLIPVKILRVFQRNQYYYRLAVENDSIYIAKNVEIDIEEIKDDGSIIRNNFISAPLRWTHKNSTSRDIFPGQSALLDILEVMQTANEFIRVLATDLRQFPDMVVLRAGTTNIKLRYYTENGQSKDIKIKVVWNGIESFNENDLPKVSIKI